MIMKSRPTEAQIKAGNYKMKKISWSGLNISIENPKGSIRRGKGWETKMQADYGYIRGTESTDGDLIDVFVGSDKGADNVYVVNQIDQATGKFDEHKCMIGYGSQVAAKAGYLANYEKGWKCGKIVAMPVERFKQWLNEGRVQKKPAK